MMHFGQWINMCFAILSLMLWMYVMPHVGEIAAETGCAHCIHGRKLPNYSVRSHRKYVVGAQCRYYKYHLKPGSAAQDVHAQEAQWCFPHGVSFERQKKHKGTPIAKHTETMNFMVC